MKKLKDIICITIGILFLIVSLALIFQDIVGSIFFLLFSILFFQLGKKTLIEFQNKLHNKQKQLQNNFNNKKSNYTNKDSNNSKISTHCVDFTNNSTQEWNISISFGKSSSANFPQAVALAQMAPHYIENDFDGQILYQSIYSSSPKDFLLFIKLYELVCNWKSCYTFINGQIVDRKIIQKLNYCYGDKCRSGNKYFCYGASYMTQNPFGCHRLQISACNNPLYEFYVQTGFNTYTLDKNKLMQKIIDKSEIYSVCPCFNLQHITDIVDNLPIHINKFRYKKLIDFCSDENIIKTKLYQLSTKKTKVLF